MGKLTAAGVKAITKPGRHGDGDGLHLNVTESGAKSWVLRITIKGRRRDIGLGSAKTVSLADARNRAHEHRVAVAEGRDPLAEKRRGDTPTFAEAAKAVHKAHLPTWSDGKHTVEWLRTLERHAFPVIGKTRVDEIQRIDVLQVLDDIWSDKPETARRVRQRMRLVFGSCIARGYIEHNPAGEGINAALPPMPKVQEHFRSMDYREVPDALKAVEASEAAPATKLCLRFTILTAARSGEARNALWSEIDLDDRIWELSPERMKMRRPHRVPLSDAALDVLDRAKALGGRDLVFPSPLKRKHERERERERPLSNNTMLSALRRCDLLKSTTVHGFRSSFRTWAAECTNVSWEIAEAALAHRLGNQTERSYMRTDFLGPRRVLMQEWADFLATGRVSLTAYTGGSDGPT